MGKGILPRLTGCDEELAFERERLFNLIDTKIRRGEIDVARGLAGELFKTETDFALVKKTRELKKYNDLLLRFLMFLIGVLCMSTALLLFFAFLLYYK